MKLLRVSVPRRSRGNAQTVHVNAGDGVVDDPAAALAGWESEGGGNGESTRPGQATGARLLGRGKAATTSLAKATRQRTRRARHALAIKRLESRIKANIDALGHEVFPLLLTGDEVTEAPGVTKRMAVIATLQEKLERQQASMARLSAPRDSEQTKQASIANVDSNATREATRSQSASDANAEASDQLPDQGGQG